MTLDDLRLEMASYRRCADDVARSLKDPNITLEKLRVLYEKFDDIDRGLADQVLSEWVLSEDEGLRFDALALIDDLGIDTAMPALHQLTAQCIGYFPAVQIPILASNKRNHHSSVQPEPRLGVIKRYPPAILPLPSISP